MKSIKMYPSKELLHEYFDYCQSGNLIWKKKTSKYANTLIGSVAGCIDAEGYKIVRFFGVNYRLHRLIWIFHHGEIPNGLLVDHMAGVESNRIEDLQLLDSTKNIIKKKMHSNNTSGYRGVSFNNGKYQAEIALFGDKIYLGTFDTAEEAAHAYDEAAFDLFGDRFAQTNFPKERFYPADIRQ